jgi:hypothetical protein
MVADRERGDHGSRRDLESFHDELSDEQSDDRRYQKRLNPFFVKGPFLRDFLLSFGHHASKTGSQRERSLKISNWKYKNDGD